MGRPAPANPRWATVLVDELRAQGRRVAHVPQSPDEALDPLRSMAFHWREAEQALGLPADSDRRKRLFEALKIDGGDLRKRPWGWSRGMQQRFVIAMTLIDMPDLIVLDEPTSALDPVVAANTMDLLDSHLAGAQNSNASDHPRSGDGGSKGFAIDGDGRRAHC